MTSRIDIQAKRLISASIQSGLSHNRRLEEALMWTANRRLSAKRAGGDRRRDMERRWSLSRIAQSPSPSHTGTRSPNTGSERRLLRMDTERQLRSPTGARSEARRVQGSYTDGDRCGGLVTDSSRSPANRGFSKRSNRDQRQPNRRDQDVRRGGGRKEGPNDSGRVRDAPARTDTYRGGGKRQRPGGTGRGRDAPAITAHKSLSPREVKKSATRRRRWRNERHRSRSSSQSASLVSSSSSTSSYTSSSRSGYRSSSRDSKRIRRQRSRKTEAPAKLNERSKGFRNGRAVPDERFIRTNERRRPSSEASWYSDSNTTVTSRSVVSVERSPQNKNKSDSSRLQTKVISSQRLAGNISESSRNQKRTLQASFSAASSSGSSRREAKSASSKHKGQIQAKYPEKVSKDSSCYTTSHTHSAPSKSSVSIEKEPRSTKCTGSSRLEEKSSEVSSLKSRKSSLFSTSRTAGQNKSKSRSSRSLGDISPDTKSPQRLKRHRRRVSAEPSPRAKRARDNSHQPTTSSPELPEAPRSSSPESCGELVSRAIVAVNSGCGGGGLSERFGRLAQLSVQKTAMSADTRRVHERSHLLKLCVVRSVAGSSMSGIPGKRVIWHDASPGRVSESSEPSDEESTPEQVGRRRSFEAEYRQYCGDPAPPAHLPVDWHSDVSVRYWYYRNAGYFGRRRLSLRQYQRWEQWWASQRHLAAHPAPSRLQTQLPAGSHPQWRHRMAPN